MFSWKAPAEGLWQEARLQHGELPWSRAPPELGTAPGAPGKAKGGARALRVSDSRGRCWQRCLELCPGVPYGQVPVVPAEPRSPRLAGGVGPSPDFGLLHWEFASAISWNMNLFIFKREQT